MKLHSQYKIIALILGLLLLLTSCNSGESESSQKNTPPLGGAFTLQSVDGDVSLSDFKGKVVMLYFGYTSCPDICPSSLAMMSVALKAFKVRTKIKFTLVIEAQLSGKTHTCQIS